MYRADSNFREVICKRDGVKEEHYSTDTCFGEADKKSVNTAMKKSYQLTLKMWAEVTINNFFCHIYLASPNITGMTGSITSVDVAGTPVALFDSVNCNNNNNNKSYYATDFNKLLIETMRL